MNLLWKFNRPVQVVSEGSSMQYFSEVTSSDIAEHVESEHFPVIQIGKIEKLNIDN